MQRVARELADLPCHLDAGRAGADDDEREPGSAPFGIGLLLGRLERAEDAAADCQRALERLHLRRMLAPLVVAEVGVLRAAADDERVVPDAVLHRNAVDRAEQQLACREVEVGDLGEQDAHVAVSREDRAQRIRDLARRQRPGRDLVGERLEEVEVAPVDERQLDRRIPEVNGRLEPAEAAADDYYPLGHGSIVAQPAFLRT